ncbi:hypothetical protein ACN47E_005571 [Coniothyrium glycines]
MSTPFFLNALAPSDFKDLLASLLSLEESTTRFTTDWESLQAQLSSKAAAADDNDNDNDYVDDATRDILHKQLHSAQNLLAGFHDLDTHYGWVLASDYSFVARALDPRARSEDAARRWVSGKVRRYTGLREEVLGIQERIVEMCGVDAMARG